MVSIHVTCIEHRHGTNFYANRTPEGAFQALYTYVCDEWVNEQIAEQRNPQTNTPFGPIGHYDPPAAIEIYFEQVGTEHWSRDEVVLED